MHDIKITLYRMVNSRIRYYSLALYNTLFGEYLLVKENGSLKNKRATRIIREHFSSYTEAYRHFELKLKEKYKKGYLPKDEEEGGRGNI